MMNKILKLIRRINCEHTNWEKTGRNNFIFGDMVVAVRDEFTCDRCGKKKIVKLREEKIW